MTKRRETVLERPGGRIYLQPRIYRLPEDVGAPKRTKNKQRHEVPLSAQALAIIEAIPGVDGDYLFTSSPTRRLGNMAPAKVALDTHMRPAQPWVMHDLRRTAASGMAALGVTLPVIEKVLNHKSGTFKGVLAIYQRYEFAAEKRDALQRWADYVEALVSGKAADVVPFRIGR